jgi:type I restriction enzyme S subunit
MSKWKEGRLGDVCEIIGGGTPSTKKDEYWNGDISWITPKDLSNYKRKYIFEGERNITKKGLNNSSTKLLPKGTILFTSRAPIGYIAIAGKELCTNQGFKSLICKDEAYNQFFYYLMKFKTQDILKIATGSTFKEVSATNLKNLKIPLPPLSIQKKIADILSIIDEKIETLQNINETLEEMARAIFKSWFVDFEIVQAKQSGKSDNEIAKEFGISEKIVRLFPSEFETSEIGKIPKGWGVAYLGERNFSEIISSGIKKFQGEKIYLATADVNNTQIINKEVKITNDNRPSRANMQPVHKSIWFAKMKDSRKLLMFDDYSDIDSYILSTGFAGIKTTTG